MPEAKLSKAKLSKAKLSNICGELESTVNVSVRCGATGATGPSGIAGLNGAAVHSATNAATATTATTALTANNALSLGGTPASGFTRSDCASTIGQIKGFALVHVEPVGSFKPVAVSYNCNGQSVEAEHVGLGHFRVKFNGNPAAIAVGSDNSPTGDAFAATVGVAGKGEGLWDVVVQEGTTHEDDGSPAPSAGPSSNSRLAQMAVAAHAQMHRPPPKHLQPLARGSERIPL